MSSFNQVPNLKSPVEALVSEKKRNACGGFSALVGSALLVGKAIESCLSDLLAVLKASCIRFPRLPSIGLPV